MNPAAARCSRDPDREFEIDYCVTHMRLVWECNRELEAELTRERRRVDRVIGRAERAEAALELATSNSKAWLAFIETRTGGKIGP